MADPGGIFVKSDDGALYFVRDELLASCKVEGEDLEKWGPVVDGETPEVEGFAANLTMRAESSPAFHVNSERIRVNKDPIGGLDLRKTYDTVMCPW
jgi:hypothetical protein